MARDTGTGGDKAVLTDLRGRIVDSAYQAYGLNYPRPDWAEQDPGLSERDETAEICRDADGNPELDPELRDIENVPLKQDVVASFRREAAGPTFACRRASRIIAYVSSKIKRRGLKERSDVAQLAAHLVRRHRVQQS